MEVYAYSSIRLRGVDCVNERDRILVVAMIVIILLGVFGFEKQLIPDSISGQNKILSDTGKIEPFEISIQGSIVDNYANVSYRMLYDNYASTEAQEIEWFLGLQAGLRLSNISVELGGEFYWGRVYPELQAVQIYNESVEANKSAVLVQRYADGYTIKMNVESGAQATLSVFVEGLLTRQSGLYTLGLPVGRAGIVNTGFAFELEIISNYAPVTGYSVRGLPSQTVSDLSNGIKLEYSTGLLTIEERIEVIYTLDRQIGGAQLLTHSNGSDNFFVYLLAPIITEDTDSAPRQYVFVLDRSGSMSGLKIQQAKIAFNSMIGSLRSIDTFNVIAFDHIIDTLWIEPHSASTNNIQEAQNWIAALAARGSTDFHGAAITGLEMFIEGENVKAMLILSDGLPTAGEIQSASEILSAIQEANTLDVSIATVAFGSDSDENLMANIASQNNGFFVFIEPDEDASTKLIDFYKTFSTPVADNYDIDFNGAIEVISLSPLSESPFFNGSEIVVSGRYIEGMTVSTSIDYITGPETYSDTIGAASEEHEHVEFIWAQQRITYLLMQVSIHGDNEILRSQLVNIGMQYGIAIAGYTAMVLTTYCEYLPQDDADDSDSIYPPPSYINAPVTATAAPGTPPPVAFDTSLRLSLPSLAIICMVGLIALVFIISRSRRS